MSETRHSRGTHQSSPHMIAVRMDQARADNKPMDIDEDEVTGVIDVALERARAVTDAGIATVREAIRKLDAKAT